MFPDRSRQELEAVVIVVSSSTEARSEMVQRLHVPLTRKFFGETVRLAVKAIAPEQLSEFIVNADLIVALDATSIESSRQLIATRPGEVCLVLINGMPLPTPAWEVSCAPEELLIRCHDQFALGVEENRLKQEVRLDDPSTREALTYRARLDVLTHIQESWGECVEEYTPAALPMSRPYWFVAACAPSKGRPFWSYSTVGLSLAPQKTSADSTRIELVAYSAEQDVAIADALLAVSAMVEGAEPDAPPIAANHTVELDGPRFFGVVEAPESDAFHAFPTEGTFGLLFGGAQVTFLQLVPFSTEQCAEAQQDGAVAVAARLDRTKGWAPLRVSAKASPWWKFWN